MSGFERKHGCPYCWEEGINKTFFEELELIEHVQTVHGGRRTDQYNF